MSTQITLLAFLVAAGPLEKGETLLEKGDLAGAQKAFEEAAKAAPKDARPIFYLGVVAQRKNNIAGAVTHYKKAVELDPKLAEGWSNLAAIDIAQGHPEAAAEEAKKATAAAPDSYDAWYTSRRRTTICARPKRPSTPTSTRSR